MLQQNFPSPEILGQFRQFGEFGPAYKVMSPIRPLENNDWLLLIEVAETGENVEYRYSRIQNDPVAH
ncbi:MAG: hypothetical protein ACI8WB_005411 [Phenylobacterium sp.]|jgi:hypothetical protein